MRKNTLRFPRLLVVYSGLFLSFVAFTPAFAQAPAPSVSGTVVDADGKVVAGVAITLKNDASGQTLDGKSTDQGTYSIGVQQAGTYTLTATAPGFAEFRATSVKLSATDTLTIPVNLAVAGVSQAVTVTEQVELAAQMAPEGNSLESNSAKTEITGAFIRNYLTPIADYGEVVNYAPGTMVINPNGAGLGQAKIFFRGLQDGQYNVTFDGIPFTDTNSVSHHTWANFPAEFIGSTDFDRSPGDASEFGPSTFGGAINLKSVDLQASPDIRATVAYGSWDTRLLKLDFDSGLFGPGNKNDISIDLHQMESNGYQTFNYQKQDGGDAKYQYRLSSNTTISLYSGVLDVFNNSPGTGSPTRAQVAEFGNNYLLDSTPTCLSVTASCLTVGTPDPYYYGLNTYHIQTDFEYAGFDSNLGNGWRLNFKPYTYRYWNHEVYQNGATINLTAAKPSGVDKQNGYRQAGETFTITKDMQWGTFSTGAWYNWAYTDRYQVPENPITLVLTPLSKFHEKFITQTVQPFAQYQWRPLARLVITAGIKENYFLWNFNQYQDGSTVGCLGGAKGTNSLGQAICIGGAAFIAHSQGFNNWLPSISARYQVMNNMSVYAQFGEGVEEPPTSIYDVPNAQVTTPALPTIAKTYQTGTVYKRHRFTLDADAFYIHFQNAYDTYTDPITLDPVSIASGPLNAKGVEGEGTVVIGWGLSLYMNASMESAKYQEGLSFPNGGLWEAATPKNVEAISLLYNHKNYDFGFITKRVGVQYNDNGSLTYAVAGIPGSGLPFPVDQAITIAPFNLSNLYLNYTFKQESWLRGSKLSFSVNNLFDHHNIVGVTPLTAATGATGAAAFTPNGGDTLNILPGRSVMVSITAGWAPRR